MRLLLSVFISIISCYAPAQTHGRESYDLWGSEYISEEKEWFVYGNKVLLRNDSSSAGAVLDTLLAGTKIDVKRKTAAFSTVNNIYAPWMQVEYAGKQGYVWLGLLAFKHQQKGDTVFLYGIDKVATKSIEPGFDETYLFLGLKVVHEHITLDKKEWKIAGDESSSFADCKLLGNMGLQNTHEILRINIGGEACGIPTNYFYHGWNGQRLITLPGKYSVGDADVYYHTETLLFPAEKGGRAGHIIKVIEEEEMLEEEKNGKPAKYKKRNSREVYAWNGETAVKVK